MINDEYKVIGVMSGTSLDGIDLVYVTFQKGSIWRFKILHAETFEYDFVWRKKLQRLIKYSKEELEKVDIDYTLYLANIINGFIKKYNIDDVDAICSHGHTALHQPQKKLTYQIGNRPALATLTNHRVVCDFRVQDVALGGQGAPLVPIGDELLFSEYGFCLNLGGFANVSTNNGGLRIAYDICPVNIVLNHFVKYLGYDYDNKGNIAATGMVNEPLLNKLNGLEFYKKPYPKSLGLEWVNKVVFPLIDSYKMKPRDILRTFIEHIAIQISKEINKRSKTSVFITGGGVYNEFLIKRIESYSKNTIVIPSNEIIEFKEALIFGFLGILRLRNEVNSLKSVTGATKDHSSGHIFESEN